MIADKIRWDTKWSDKQDYEIKPVPFITENLNMLAGNTVLDVACGYGKIAVYLAQKGFIVTGIDISSSALNRLNEFSLKYNVSIKSLLLDLDDLNSVTELDCFDNIIICRFRPSNNLFDILVDKLNKDGILLYSIYDKLTIQKKHKCYGEVKENKKIEEENFCDNKKIKLLKFKNYIFDNDGYEVSLFKKIV